MALLYHDEDDLIEVQPDIYNFGVDDYEPQMLESEEIVNRALDSRWYRGVARNYGVDFRETPFEPAKVTTSQVRRLATYKSLDLIYMSLAKIKPEADGFERLSDRFNKRYREELSDVLNAGIDYDWDASDDISSDERAQPKVRRLVRC